MERRSAWTRSVVATSLLLCAGCATTVPYVGQGPHPQIERGRPVIVVDTIGNALALLDKLLFLDLRFANHAISPETESYIVAYLDSHQKQAGDSKIRLNQYAPHKDLVRLIHNHHTAWPYRLLLGTPTLLMEALLPGRIFPWGDFYDPWTNTAHLYSDHPAISLHELGHIYDINRRRFAGSYAALRLLPFVDLFQEWNATKQAIDYLKQTENPPAELAAYKILYPAYGSYVGGYIFPPIGTLGGIVLGHAAGRSMAALRAYELKQEAQEKALESFSPATTAPQPEAGSSEPAAPSTSTPTDTAPSATPPNTEPAANTLTR